MAARSTLIVAGRKEESLSKDRLEKLIFNCLITAYGEEATGVDAEFAQYAAAFAKPAYSEEFGLNAANDVTGLHLVRVQYNPTASQFRACLRDCFSHALNTGRVSETEASIDGHVTIVYAGQVMAHTGEWLLADCALDGHQVLSWLDSKAARAWWPQLDKFPNIGDRLHAHLLTPLAGPGTTWPMNKNGHPLTLLTHVDVRMVELTLNIEGSWRSNGKQVVLDPTHSASYEGIRSFVQLAIDHHPSTVLSLTSDSAPLGCALSAQRPALYFFPGGGITSQASALFSIQGFTMLLGGAFTSNTPPNWWAMIRNLPKLDAIVLPDWSASNLLSYRFLLDILESKTSESKVLGAILLPSPTSPNEPQSEFTLSQPIAVSNAQQSTWAPANLATENLPPAVVLYSKFGWGELKLQPLAQRAGLVVLWSSRLDQSTDHTPLRILLPTTQLSGASPVQGLGRLLKSLASVPQLEVKQPTPTKGAHPAKVLGARPATSKPSPPQSRIANATNKPLTNQVPKKTLRDASPRKPSAPPPKRPTSAITAPSTRATLPATKVPARPQTAQVKPHVPSKTVPTKTLASVPPSKQSTVKAKNGTTADRLAAHANLVASKKPAPAPSAPKPKTTTATPVPKKPSTLSSKPKIASPLPEEIQPEIPPATNVQDNSPHESHTLSDQLRDSLELAAVDPLMSGWRSLDQSETHLPQAPPVPEPTAEPEPVPEQNLPSKDAPHPVVRAAEPAELYKVHKFEHFDEADEMEETPVPEDSYFRLEQEQKHTISPGIPISEDIPKPIAPELGDAEQFDQPSVDHPVESKAHELFPSEAGTHMSSETVEPLVANLLRIIDSAAPNAHQNEQNATHLPEEKASRRVLAQADSPVSSPNAPSSSTMGDEQICDFGHDEAEVEVIEAVEKIDQAKLQSFVPGYFEGAEDGEPGKAERSHMIELLTAIPPGLSDDICPKDHEVSDALADREPLNEAPADKPEVDQFVPCKVPLDENEAHIIPHSDKPEEGEDTHTFGLSLKEATDSIQGEQDAELVPGFTATPDETHFSHFEQGSSLPSSVEVPSDPLSLRPDSLDGSNTASPISKQVQETELGYPRAHPDVVDEALHQTLPMDTHLDQSEPSMLPTEEHTSEHVELRTDSLEDIVVHEEELPAQDIDSRTVLTHVQPSPDKQLARNEPQLDPGFVSEHMSHFEQALHAAEPDLVQSHQVAEELKEVSTSYNDFSATMRSDSHQEVLAKHTTSEEEREYKQSSVRADSPFTEDVVHHEDASSYLSQMQERDPSLTEPENLVLSSPVSMNPEQHSGEPTDEKNVDHESSTFMDKVPYSETDIHHEDASHNLSKCATAGDVMLTGMDNVVLASPTEFEIPATTNAENLHGEPTGHPSFEESVEYDVSKYSDKSAITEERNLPQSTFSDEPEMQLVHDLNVTDNEDLVPEASDDTEIHLSLHPEQHVEASSDRPEFIESEGTTSVNKSPVPEAAYDFEQTVPDVVPIHRIVEDYEEVPTSTDAFELHSSIPPEKELGEPDELRAPEEEHKLKDEPPNSMPETFVSEENGHFECAIPRQPETQTADGFSGEEHSMFSEASKPIEIIHGTPEFSDLVESHDWPAYEYQAPPPASGDQGSDISDFDSNGREFWVSGKPDSSEHISTLEHEPTEASEEPSVAPIQDLAGDNCHHLLSENGTTHEGLMDNSHPTSGKQLLDESIVSPSSETDFGMSDTKSLVQDASDEVSPTPSHPVDFPQSFHSDVVHSTTSPTELPTHPEKLRSVPLDTPDESHWELQHEQQQPADSTTVDGVAELHESNALKDGEARNDYSPLTLDATGDHLDDHVNLASPLSEASMDSVVRGPTHGTGLPADDNSVAVSSTRPEELPESLLGHPEGFSPVSEFPVDHQQFEPHENGTNGNVDGSIPLQHQVSETNGVHSNGNGTQFDEDWGKFGDLSPAAKFKMIPTLADGSPVRKSLEFSETHQDFALEDHQHHSLHMVSPAVDVADGSVRIGESPVGDHQDQFNPLLAWGKPQGLPAPVLPSTLNKSSAIKTATPGRPTSSARPGSASKGPATAPGKSAPPPTLPPGPAVFLDLIWVPTYLPRVPHDMAVEFFSRVRARTYVLSGEALHPMIGEALMEGKAKWGPHDVEHLCRTPNSSSDASANAITILPTDEPYEWTCWLRTPCGRLDRETGESRLQASGFNVLPAASLCDIEYTAGNVAFRCEGVRVDF